MLYVKYVHKAGKNKKTNNSIKKWAKDFKRHSPKEDIQMAISVWKGAHHRVRELPMKTTMRCHYIPIRVVEIPNTNYATCWQGCRATGIPTHGRRECKMIQPLDKTCWQFLTKQNIVSPNKPATDLRIYPTELITGPHKNLPLMFTLSKPVFGLAFFTSTTSPKQARCSS